MSQLVAPPLVRNEACQTILASLVSGVAAQNESAIADLYDATVSAVYGLLLRLVKDTVLAEGLLVETYYRIWQDASDYEPARGTVTVWILTIARDRAKVHLSKTHNAGQQRFRLSGDSDFAKVLHHDPVRCSVLDSQRIAVSVALTKFTEIQRNILFMAYFEGYTHGEIAAESCLSMKAVATCIRTGLHELRIALQQDAFLPPCYLHKTNDRSLEESDSGLNHSSTQQF